MSVPVNAGADHKRARARRARRRRYLVRGRLRVPFEGYERDRRARYGEPACEGKNYPVSTFGPDDGLTPHQAWVAKEQLTSAIRRRRVEGRPCTGPYLAAVKAGVVSAVRGGRVGNREWGCRLRRQKAAKATATRHREQLRVWASLGGQARARQRRQQKAKVERARLYAAMTPRQHDHDRLRRSGPDAVAASSEW